MKIGIVGASGNIGSRVLTEARARGHEVVAFTRQGTGDRPADEGVEWRTLDVFDVEAVRREIQHLDVLVSAYHPGNSAKDIVDAIGRAIADPSAYARAARVLLEALEDRPATRLIVVGGAENLEIYPHQNQEYKETTLNQGPLGIGRR